MSQKDVVRAFERCFAMTSESGLKCADCARWSGICSLDRKNRIASAEVCDDFTVRECAEGGIVAE